MSTTSTANLWRQVRTRILTFTPPSGGTLQTRLGGRLYYAQAPDNAPWPHGIGTLELPSSGAYNADRQAGTLEIMLYDRPRTGEVAGGITRGERLEDMADVVQMALLRWSEGSSATGLAFSREMPYRKALPANIPPADREVCGIRMVFQLVAWPTFITQYATS